MAKIKDKTIDGEVPDSYREHNEFHQSYHSDCSECYKEARLTRAFRLVNTKTHAELLKKYPALSNPFGGNYPLGFRPE